MEQYDATYRWDGGFPPMEQYDGQTMTVIRPLEVPAEADAEVGPMFRVRMHSDQSSQDVYADEIEVRR